MTISESWRSQFIRDFDGDRIAQDFFRGPVDSNRVFPTELLERASRNLNTDQLEAYRRYYDTELSGISPDSPEYRTAGSAAQIDADILRQIQEEEDMHFINEMSRNAGPIVSRDPYISFDTDIVTSAALISRKHFEATRFSKRDTAGILAELKVTVKLIKQEDSIFLTVSILTQDGSVVTTNTYPIHLKDVPKHDCE
jgi:hypothetical protein